MSRAATITAAALLTAAGVLVGLAILGAGLAEAVEQAQAEEVDRWAWDAYEGGGQG